MYSAIFFAAVGKELTNAFERFEGFGDTSPTSKFLTCYTEQEKRQKRASVYTLALLAVLLFDFRGFKTYAKIENHAQHKKPLYILTEK